MFFVISIKKWVLGGTVPNFNLFYLNNQAFLSLLTLTNGFLAGKTNGLHFQLDSNGPFWLRGTDQTDSMGWFFKETICFFVGASAKSAPHLRGVRSDPSYNKGNTPVTVTFRWLENGQFQERMEMLPPPATLP